MQRKKIIYSICFIGLIIIALSCNNRGKKDAISSDLVHIPVSAEGENSDLAMPKFEFERTDHDFGTLIQGEKVSFTYKFKNSGTSDLIISTVVPGCGCTVAQFTKTPVKKGEEGFITINLDTENKKGPLRKKVAVQANTYPAETNLWFSATVELP
ncbi:MAG TPA: DUF1573 domain-containing protein [Bacteroidales bacterium]|jgi:hypothetical protein|nr:DUF1573 domain-containing protein [Bacteroidales bacterium]HON20421.1 DUF1573 domain-containing protein [Bacteroidales bacterium]HOR81153.1 DUF1573 domain-containing protein [Bacteroidales bacterium]HPJ90725.1 DUF1573 domain-containing protein [Bacteroidales bacterium]HQB19103.1 DUF1573 domain-containing protein [Bacteroidales bacterium]